MMRAGLMALCLLAACGANEGGGKDLGGGGGDGGGMTGSDGGDTCNAPDVLVLLDRTGTMHRDLLGNTPPDTPAGHASAKITMAIHAIQGLVTHPGLDQTLRFGLALFPQDPGAGCLTLTQRLQGMDFSNPACQAGQIVVSPALGTGNTIAGAIDPETTTLCFSTPTGAGILTASDELMRIAQPGVAPYIMLVTDGADFYQSCPNPDPLPLLQDLSALGIKTFIVGFGAQDTTAQGVNPPLLNRMACAGRTAKNFATACTQLPSGGYDAVDPNGATLYYDAADQTGLQSALGTIAASLCCGCIL